MDKIVDARGLACPQPVILAKKEIDGGTTEFAVRVDNDTACENLRRLASSNGFIAQVEGASPDFVLTFSRDGSAIPASSATPAPEVAVGEGDTAYLITRETMGGGAEELGATLMKMFLYTLSQGTDAPGALLFLNGGVKIPTLNDEAIVHLKALADRGTDILVCGTCLNYYGLADQLAVGTVSNMYDIVTRLQASAKAVTL